MASACRPVVTSPLRRSGPLERRRARSRVAVRTVAGSLHHEALCQQRVYGVRAGDAGL